MRQRKTKQKIKKKKKRIDKLNQADSMIFQTEKQLKEFGDKLPADKKGPIEAALAKLKDAHKAQSYLFL
jgi:molecular chaperone DnaK